MFDPNWKVYFEPQILMRGYQYFNEDHIARSKRDKDGLHATIRGSQDYEVLVSDRIVDSTCTCPYFADHGLCKHIAAACYEKEYLESITGETVKESQNDTSASAEELVKNLSHSQQQNLLLDIIRADERWREMIIHRYGSVNLKQVKIDFITSVNRIVYANSDHGFVSYRTAYQCEQELRDYVAAFLDSYWARDAYDVVLELTFVFSQTLLEMEVDDSDGFFTTMVNIVNSYWEDLLSLGREEIDTTLFDWLVDVVQPDEKRQSDPDSAYLNDTHDDWYGVYSYLKDNARTMIELWFATDIRFTATVQELASTMISDDKLLDQQKPYVCYTGETTWICMYLRCMLTLGYSFDSMVAYALDHSLNERIIDILIGAALSSPDDEVAIARLKDLIEQVRNRTYPTKAALQLLELLEKYNHDDEMAELSIDLIVNSDTYNDKQFRKWIKQARKYLGEEWLNIEAQLIKVLANDRWKLKRFYAETRHLDELMNLIKQHGSLDDLRHFKKLLSKQYSEDYLACYEESVRFVLFGPATKRESYRRGIEIFYEMLDIPGGEAAVKRLVDELCETYPRRSALIDELDAFMRYAFKR